MSSAYCAPMTKKTDLLIGSLLAGAIVCICAIKLSKGSRSSQTLAAQGFAAFNERKFEEALILLLQVKDPTFEVDVKIYECYEQLGNLASALIYLNRCVKAKRLNTLIMARFKIHMSLEMSRAAFKDLFLLNLIHNDLHHKDSASEFLKQVSADLARTHKIEGFASRVNYADFFETLFFLKDIQDPAIVFLNSSEYEKCFEFVKESEEPLHRLLLACFYLVNGEFSPALKTLEPFKTGDSALAPYFRMLIYFIRSKKLTSKEVDALRAKAGTETDPTVLFYISKVFDSIDERTLQFEALQRCMNLFPHSCVSSALAVWYIRQGNQVEASRLIKLALKEYPDSMNLACIALEYFLLRKNLDEASALMERSEQAFPDDPRVFLFKYTISEALGRPEPKFLEHGISLDPNYFKLYIYLGNVCSTGEESMRAYKEALRCARSYDEIFTAYQLLVVTETQNELFREFPDLFR